MTTATKKVRPRRTSAGTHFEKFCAAYCRHTKGRWSGKPLIFEPWQRAFWHEALETGPDGKRIYNFVLSGRPRKNAKTTECAALGLYMLGADEELGPDVAVAAGSADQANMVFGQARDFVERHPTLRAAMHPGRSVITCPSSHGVMRRVSAEGKLIHGLNLSCGIIDELHALTNVPQRELYAAMVTATAAREQPLMAAITTAGYDANTILGAVYQDALKAPEIEIRGRYKTLTIARDRKNGFLMYWWAAPEGADPENVAILRACNPLKGIDPKWLLKRLHSPDMTELTFRRLHMNQWTTARDAWLPEGTWRDLEAPDLELPEGTDIYVGVDAALKYDTTAVAWVGRHPDGRIVISARVWSARSDAPHHVFVPGGRIDNELPEMFITNTLAAKYRVVEVGYDPRFFDTPADHMARKGLTVTEVPQQGAIMSDAYQYLYAAATSGELAHDGDRVLWAHADAAAAVLTERGWKLYKLKASQPFDAMVAGAMALYRLKSGASGEPMIHWL